MGERSSNDNLRNMLIKYEGLRLKPYRDSVGKLTLGRGRNIEDVGISEEEANLMLANDIQRVLEECSRTFPWFKSVSVVRQDVVMNMVFNMGMPKFSGFIKMISAINGGRFDQAADEMMLSHWAGQVGARASELAQMMRTDRYL